MPSVAEVQNTTVTLLAGTAVNAFGDAVDAGVPQVQGVPACIIETSEKAWDPASQTPRTVRTIVCWLPYWSNPLAGFEGQQILDEQRGDTYFIEDIVQPSTLIGAPTDIRLSLRRVSGPNV